MPKLPVVSGKKLIKALSKLGYWVYDQDGSHVHVRHPTKRPITIPYHKEIARGTLRKILREAEIDVGKLIKLLK